MFNEKTLDSRQMSAPGFYSLLLWQRLDDAFTWAEFQTQTLEKKNAETVKTHGWPFFVWNSGGCP